MWGGGLRNMCCSGRIRTPIHRRFCGLKSHAFENSSLDNIWVNPNPFEWMTMGAYIGCLNELWIFSRTAQCIYLLLIEFKGRTVSYGSSFSSLIYGPSTKHAGHKSKEKKRGSVTYSTHRENKVSKIFIISLVCVWGAQERFWRTSKAKQINLKSFWSR